MKALLNFNEKVKVCPYRHPLPADFQRKSANHISLLRDTPISRRRSGNVLSEEGKWKNLASANTKN
jgi:hypothetical protein